MHCAKQHVRIYRWACVACSETPTLPFRRSCPRGGRRYSRAKIWPFVALPAVAIEPRRFPGSDRARGRAAGPGRPPRKAPRVLAVEDWRFVNDVDNSAPAAAWELFAGNSAGATAGYSRAAGATSTGTGWVGLSPRRLERRLVGDTFEVWRRQCGAAGGGSGGQRRSGLCLRCRRRCWWPFGSCGATPGPEGTGLCPRLLSAIGLFPRAVRCAAARRDTATIVYLNCRVGSVP